ncbi:major facilitator superfamily domain-containing protein [Triangularia verruculosa]|uniref:Major facilitator superfamily domain-containing protein n=1 Tax=Triangularia verruculosa TaxID=2587418 RepID=A0AAN6XCK4_9PEZI|nr:major facilitator superfamily domain-containing protein [Triangularia verruculosa]
MTISHSSQASQTNPSNSSNGDDTEKQPAIITSSPLDGTLAPLPPSVNKYRIAALSLAIFTSGLTDSSVGPLIEPMKAFYNLTDDKLISLLFVAQAVGFILGAAAISPLRSIKPFLNHDNITLLSANIIVFLSYLPFVCLAPLPAILVSFLPLGFGNSFNLAIGNVYCGSLKERPTFYLGVMHACYGLGATIGPLIATGMVVQTGISYGFFYSVTLCLSLVNAILLFAAFREYPPSPPPPGAGDEEGGGSQATGPVLVTTTTTVEKEKKTPGLWIKSHLHLDSKLVILTCLFIFFYQGAEVSNSGWTTEFLYDRHPASKETQDTYGYVMTGFWAGVTLGRVVLTPMGERFPGGNRGYVYMLVVLCVAFQLMIWLVPNLYGRGLAVAFFGMFIGPGYPCAMRVVMELMEEKESETANGDDEEKEHGKAGAMGVISAFGMSGGAVMPFIIGNLNGIVGRWVMHPIVLALCALMVIVWWFLPRSKAQDKNWQPGEIHMFLQRFLKCCRD